MSSLGLGVQRPTARWGAMLNDARAHFRTPRTSCCSRRVAVMLAVIIVTFNGDALRDLLDRGYRIEAGMNQAPLLLIGREPG